MGFMCIQLLLILLGVYRGVEFLGRSVAYLTGREQSTVLLGGGSVWMLMESPPFPTSS